MTICTDTLFAAIDTGRKSLVGVGLDPSPLVLRWRYLKWKAATVSRCILGHQLHWLPTCGVLWFSRRAGFKDPVGVRRYCHVHVINGEELDRSADIVCRIEGR